MQVLRTIVWVVITVVLVSFIAMNWEKAPVNFWPLEDGKKAFFEWPVGFTAFVFFLLGFLPTWLVYRARVWQMNRRIASLESSLRAAASVASSDPNAQPDESSEEKIEN